MMRKPIRTLHDAVLTGRRGAWLARTALTAVGLAVAGAAFAAPAFAATVDAATVAAAAHFEEPLLPLAAPAPAENAALLHALDLYRAQAAKDDFSVFQDFLHAHPDSPWRVALTADMALLDYHYGYFSRAIDHWQQAWSAGRGSTDPRIKALVDRVAGELLRMHARLGHADAIEALIADIGDRKLTGQATEELTGAREGLYVFRHDPGIGYLCGPMALKNLLLAVGRPADQVTFLDDYRSGPRGVSLAEVASLAEKAKLDFHLVHREADQPIPIPSVVHWKVSHFAAIVGEKNGRYHIKDPTFGHDLWVTRGALDTEGSGYYLALGKQDAGPWRLVASKEAANIRGMGYTNDNDPDDDTPDDPDCDCGGSSSAAGASGPGEASAGSGSGGMTRYAFTEMLSSLKLQDSPVGYAPPRGPAVPVTITYNQREASQPANFSFYNVSPKWSLNWLAYIQDDPTNAGGNVQRIVGGGGSITEGGYNAATQTFTMEEKTGAVLATIPGGQPGYTLTFPDGSVNTYNVSNGATTYPRIVFLNAMADRFGNALTFTYDAQYRLTSIKDATARLTKFAYGNASFPLQVTKVTDPFSRSATLAYDSTGRLSQITDALGLVSKYAYDATNEVNSLTTPYGTTSFSYGDSGNSRFLQATDPLGQTERTEFFQGAPNIPFSDPASTVPQGIIAPFNEYLNDRDTYYWDKHAYATAPGDYTQARQRHWVHLASNTNITGGVIESIKYPLENRIWFNYPGQPNGGLGTAQNGNLDSPSNIGRVLDNGSTQLTQMQYNSLGNVTSRIDPAGRQTMLSYASNLIDLATVQQKTASGMATVAQFGNYVKHEPQTYTDASGKVSKLSYNAAGQLTQVTDPLGQSVKYTYNASGYLLSTTNQNGQTAATYALDSFGRVQTLTDSEGRAITYAYDAFNRVTQETYPDGTTRKFAYKNLDLISVTDRQGRKTSLAYDANRNLVSLTDPVGNVTKFSYFENGKLKTMTDASGNVTAWAIDIEGRTTTKTYADATTSTNTYETTTSRLKSVQDALGQVRQLSYTLDNQLAGIAYQNAVNPTPSVSYTYDPYFPRVASMTDGSGTTTYTYGAPGQPGALLLAQETGPATHASVSYGRDALGRVVMRRVGANPETFSYDAVGRIVTDGNDLGEFALSYLGQTGQITGLSASGIGTQWTYDTNANDRRLLSISNGPNARSFGYTTTTEGDITGISETLGGTTQKWTDGYDAADRLMSAALSTGASFGYAYDKAGNTTSITTGSGTTNLAYNVLNQAKAFAGKNFTYDANGNLTRDDQHTYQWDAENRLVSIGFIGQTGMSESFRYDGRNHRIAQVVQNGSTTTETHYFWCEQVLCEARNARDKVIRRYYAEGEEAPAAGTLLYYGRDVSGTVRDVLSAQNGSLVGSTDYDPYGNVIRSSGAATTDFRFGNLVSDPSSALDLATFRFYDPRLGRWLSRDPLRERGGFNLYQYGFSNPVSVVDPAGTWGGGITGGGSAEAGIPGVLGAGGTGSVGYGLFYDPNGGGLSDGAFASGGAFAADPCGAAKAPNVPGRAGAAGGFIGAGGGIFLTNADNVQGLAGPFDTYTVNIGVGPLQFSVQFGYSDGVGILSVTAGPGIGLSASEYPTTTAVSNGPLTGTANMLNDWNNQLMQGAMNPDPY